MRWEYLIFNLVIASAYVLASFYKRTVWPKPKALFFSITLVSGLFLVWDHLVTGWWWSFNSEYTLGVNLGKLPFEEILFFVSVPMAMILLWENYRLLGNNESNKVNSIVFIAVGIGAIYLSMVSWYGFVIGLLTLIVFLLLGKRLLERDFVILTFLTVVFTTIFNWYLTWRPIVVYNQAQISGFKILTIPVEDYYYGLVLIFAVVMSYERFKKHFDKIK